MKRLAAIISLLLAVLSCDPPGGNRFWITNTTRDSLYYFRAYERFPLPKENSFRPHNDQILYPYERRNLKLGAGKLDGIITSNSPQSHSMLFYTFDKQTVDTMSWADIRSRKLYKVYKFTLDELNRRDWKITLTNDYLLP